MTTIFSRLIKRCPRSINEDGCGGVSSIAGFLGLLTTVISQLQSDFDNERQTEYLFLENFLIVEDSFYLFKKKNPAKLVSLIISLN